MKLRVEKRNPPIAETELLKKILGKIHPDDPLLNNWYAQYASHHCSRIAFDLYYLKEKFPSPFKTKILEIGSLPLLFTVGAQNLEYQIMGLDKNPDRFAQTIEQYGLDVTACDLNHGKLPFSDACFDAVVMNEVLEHLQANLILVFREIHRVLKPGGMLFLSTPNLRSLVGLYRFLFKNSAYSCADNLYDEYDKEERYGHMGHIREYTSREVIGFLERNRFQVREVIYRGKYPTILFPERFLPKLKPYFSIIATKLTT